MSILRFTLLFVAAAGTLLTNCAPPTEERVPKGRVTLSFSWDPNPAEEQVLAYHIFRGADENADTPLTVVDGQTQEVEFDAHVLGLKLDNQICLRVRAENTHGLSDLSDPVCTTITADDL